MAAKPITWQQRGEYLATCQGMTPPEYAARIDTAMSNQGGTPPASGTRKTPAKVSRSGPRKGASPT